MARPHRPIRPLRLALGFTAAASAVLCLAIGAAWVRSFWVQDHVSAARAGGRYLLIVSGSGSVVVERAWGWPADQPVRWGAQPVGGMNTFTPTVATAANSMVSRTWGDWGVWRV